MKILVNTWCDSYFLFRKSINKYSYLLLLGIFLFYFFDDNYVIDNLLPSSITNYKYFYYPAFLMLFITFFLIEIYLKFILYHRLYSIRKNISCSIKDSIRFIKKRGFSSIVSLLMLAAIFCNIVNVGLVYGSNFLYTNFISTELTLPLTIINKIISSFVLVPCLIAVPCFLFSEHWLGILKGNWIRTIITIYLPSKLFNSALLLVGINNPLIILLLNGLMYLLMIHIIFVYTINLIEKYDSEILLKT